MELFECIFLYFFYGDTHISILLYTNISKHKLFTDKVSKVENFSYATIKYTFSVLWPLV